MHHLARNLIAALLHLGGFGLLALGILDSSFLIMPAGNDLLMIGLTARRHSLMPFYAAMATAGSVLGCLLTDALSRKGGEEALEKRVPKRRLNYVRCKIERSAAWALTLAALMPPPFPFTVFVAAAAALQYPRRKLLAVMAAARFVRFSVEGLLAIRFGPRILRWAATPVFQYAMAVLIVGSLAATAWSLYTWIRQSRRAAT